MKLYLNRRARRLGALGAVALLFSGAAAACSSDDDASKEKPAQSATSVDPAKVSPTDLPELPKLAQAKGAVADVAFGECKTAEGKQKVEATLTNATKSAADYVVSISWINDSSDVLARAVEVVEQAAPGKAVEMTLSATVPGDVTQCAFHVQRGDLK